MAPTNKLLDLSYRYICEQCERTFRVMTSKEHSGALWAQVYAT